MSQYHQVSSSDEIHLQKKEKTQSVSLFNQFKSLTDKKTVISYRLGKPHHPITNFSTASLSRQNISSKQFEIQAKARQELQRVKMADFKSKIYNDQFMVPSFKQDEPFSEKSDEQKEESASNIAHVEEKQQRIYVNGEDERQKFKKLANLGFDEELNKKNQRQKNRKSELVKVINQISMRNSDKPSIASFKDSYNKLQSGSSYYLQGSYKKQITKEKEKKTQKKNRQNSFKRVPKKVEDFEMNLDYDQPKKESKEKKEQKKKKLFSFTSSRKQKQKEKERQIEKQINQLIKTGKQIPNDQSQPQIQVTLPVIKLKKTHLKEFIQPVTDPESHPFVRKILSFEFSNNQRILAPRDLKIKPIFQDEHDYSFCMSTLLINECLNDVQMKMKKIVQKKQKPLDVQVKNFMKNQLGQLQITLCLNQIQKNEGKPCEGKLLSELSSAGYRLGLLTNCSQITLLSNYGVPSKHNNSVFSIVGFIQASKSQESSNQSIKIFCECQITNFQLLLMTQSQKIWFYDLDRISSHFRQYLAISSLKHSELSQFFYNPKLLIFYEPDQIHETQSFQLSKMFERVDKEFNPGQGKAIKQITEKQSGIFLLQGPPGTGKTTTLMGLISTHYQYLNNIKNEDKLENKILICAPSNTAIDLITKKLKTEGLRLKVQNKFPKIIRTGAVQTQDPDVLSVSFDKLCEDEMNKINKSEELTKTTLTEKIIELSKQLSQRKDEKIQHEIKQLQLRLASTKKKPTRKAILREVQVKILLESQIILTTLNSSGSDRIQAIRDKISLIIVDEAAQATQTSIIIPMQTGAIKVILVGDPKQLPATVLSADSATTQYNRSFFERCLDEGVKPYFLDVQYRMGSEIRLYPSLKFYSNRLKDGPNIVFRQNNIAYNPQCIQPFMKRNVLFIGVPYGEERIQNNSYCNNCEAEVISHILKMFQGHKDVSIGVITPYQSQRRIIQNLIQDPNIMVNTVDSFQGQQRDIIIVSTVRANLRGSIGFLTDNRRTNVAITRSKYLLIVVGNLKTLSTSQTWFSYIEVVTKNDSSFQLQKQGVQQQIKRILEGKTQNSDLYKGLSADDRKQLNQAENRTENLNLKQEQKHRNRKEIKRQGRTESEQQQKINEILKRVKDTSKRGKKQKKSNPTKMFQSD